MAGLYNLPHIFVVENNLWAIGMNHPRATSTTMGDNVAYIYKKGPAFGFPGVYVDGMDVVKVRDLDLRFRLTDRVLGPGSGSGGGRASEEWRRADAY